MAGREERGEGKRARVVFWAGSFERAGTQRFLVELLSRIDRTQFEPIVFSLSERGELLPRIRRSGVPVHEFGIGPGALRPATWRGLAGAALFLRRERVDILSCLLGVATLFGPVIGRLAGVPVVVNNQRNLTYWFEGGAREAVYRYVNRRVVDAVLVNSEAARKELAGRFAVPPEKIVATGAGVDLGRFAGASRDESLAEELGVAGHRIVGIVAKLSAVKGHEHFLGAARRIAEALSDVRFLVVGDGPRRAELELMAADLGIADATRFVGAREDVPELLGLMDVVVLSSLSEGAPNALMEAAAAGRPVVATSVGGVPEIVADGSTGVLVEPGDAPALAGAVLDLLENRERAAVMGRCAASLAREKFDIDAVVRVVEQTFSGLLANARTGGLGRAQPVASSTPEKALRDGTTG